jgi:NAD-dependent deacetylase
MNQIPDEQIESARRNLVKADRLVIFTGAGISAESGVPTYRGVGGLWKNFRAQDLATVAAFQRDPALVWGWYRSRRRALLDCQPNAAHRAIAEAAKERRLTLITQNVDGLHSLAGYDNPWELHGNIWREFCVECYHPVDRHAAWLNRTVEDEDAPLPKCPKCGGLLRPAIVWFGEQLDTHLLEQAFEAAEHCDAMIVIGTSGQVQPAAMLPILARRGGAMVVEINLEPTPLTEYANYSLYAPAGEVLPQLLR